MDDLLELKKSKIETVLYLHNMEITKFNFTTLELFLESLLTRESSYGYYGVPQTFFDKENENVQCSSVSFRSFYDLCRICKAYFNYCTEIDVADVLKSIILKTKNNSNKDKTYGFLFCSKAKGWVLHSGDFSWSLNENYVLNYFSSTKEITMENSGDCFFSMNEILELMNQKKI
jgi:hypothetical protein